MVKDPVSSLSHFILDPDVMSIPFPSLCVIPLPSVTTEKRRKRGDKREREGRNGEGLGG